MEIVGKEQFIDLCYQFEASVKAKYKLKDTDSCYFFLSKQKEFSTYRYAINTIRSLRNFYQHNDHEINDQEAVFVSEAVCNTLKEIISKVENPLCAKDIAVKNIYAAQMGSSVQSVIAYMNKNEISNVPILKDKKLIGVFSENTIFSRFAKEHTLMIDENTRIQDYKEYIDINDHESDCFEFVSLEEDIHQLRIRFNEGVENNKRLAMLFVTKNGYYNQDILGIITPWDLL
ncbi:MAG: CBS domain-containing protein [Erysipelotrichaceae bacterium]